MPKTMPDISVIQSLNAPHFHYQVTLYSHPLALPITPAMALATAIITFQNLIPNRYFDTHCLLILIITLSSS